MRNFLEEFKIESKVFERRTLFSIFSLMKKGVIKSLESVVKEGKESVVVAGKDPKNNWIAVKIYRTEYCDFKSMWKYLITDFRFSQIKKDRWPVVVAWARREFRNMKRVHKYDVRCPKPLAVYNNVLVMEFIGENGIPAPTLSQIKNGEVDWTRIYKEVIEEMGKMAKAKIIHTDLSQFNILFFGHVYIIDFSQGVTSKHPLAKEFLKRDIKNINSFFTKKNVRVDNNLYEKLLEAYKL